jgi:DNA-binding transcriptional LysR family regulator
MSSFLSILTRGISPAGRRDCPIAHVATLPLLDRKRNRTMPKSLLRRSQQSPVEARMDRFEQLETFVTVVRLGSLTAAAERLAVAKSAVSRRLARLEEDLGVALLTRTTRSLALTGAGERFLERAERLLADLDEARAEVAAERGVLRGRLRVAAPSSFGQEHLSPVLCAFATEHPEVHLELDFSDRRVDLVQDGVDLAVRIAELGEARVVATPLTTVRHQLVASPAYLRRHGSPRSPEALEDHAAVTYSQSSEAGWVWTARDGRTGRVAPRSVLRANDGHFLRDAAIAGLGIANEPTFLLHQALRDGRLVPVLPELRWRTLTAWAVHVPADPVPARVRALVRTLRGAWDREWPTWDRDLPGLPPNGAQKGRSSPDTA